MADMVQGAAPQQPQTAAPGAAPQQGKALKPSQAQHIKEDFNQYIAMATKLINSPETREQVLKSMGGDDPAKKIATTSVMIMQRIDSTSRKSGVEILDTVKVIGAYVVTQQLYQLGAVAGYFKLDKDYVMLAYSIAVQDYINMEAKAGQLDKKALGVQIQRDMRAMPEKQRQEITKSMQRMPQIAKRYQKDLRDGKLKGGA